MDYPKVSAKVEDGIPVLTVTYDTEEMLRPSAGDELQRAMLEKCASADKKRPDCVVILKTETAGSPLIRALFELYKRVSAEDGEVRVVGFPPDYTEVLNALGLAGLRGFALSAGDEATALSELKR